MESIALPPSGFLTLDRHFVPKQEADALFKELSVTLDWSQQSIKLFGRRVMQPRLTTFYGELGISYRYSGLALIATPWSGPLKALAQKVSETAGCCFNSVLCNLYRDGADSMGWHADDESSLGSNPVIASVSLGEKRRFDLKPKHSSPKEKISLWLDSGSLLIMGGDLQHHWLHQIAKSKQAVEPRINLTFRRIVI